MMWSLPFLPAVLALALGYLFGSVPFGLVLTRLAGTQDIRSIGSGNIGATNVLRTGRKGLAAATLVGDALKGTAAVMIAARFLGFEASLLAGVGAFVGHLFPVWLGFKGGKGVATFLGVTLGLYWPLGVVFAIVWIGMALLLRYSSLSALVASLATVLAALVLTSEPIALLLGLLTILLWFMHRANIKRLLAGTESRISSKG